MPKSGVCSKNVSYKITNLKKWGLFADQTEERNIVVGLEVAGQFGCGFEYMRIANVASVGVGKA